MSKSGVYGSAIEWGPRESFMSVAGPSVPDSTNQSVTLGTYTMPFAGRLIAEMKCLFYWTLVTQACSGRLFPSTPTPTNYSAHSTQNGLPGGFGLYTEVPMTGYWSSLASGTVVTLICTVAVGGGGGPVSVVAVGGILRASPI